MRGCLLQSPPCVPGSSVKTRRVRTSPCPRAPARWCLADHRSAPSSSTIPRCRPATARWPGTRASGDCATLAANAGTRLNGGALDSRPGALQRRSHRVRRRAAALLHRSPRRRSSGCSTRSAARPTTESNWLVLRGSAAGARRSAGRANRPRARGRPARSHALARPAVGQLRGRRARDRLAVRVHQPRHHSQGRGAPAAATGGSWSRRC